MPISTGRLSRRMPGKLVARRRETPSAPSRPRAAPTARARYNALCVKWGGKFLPPVLPDDGLKPCGANWLMDQDHLDKFATMTLWQGQPAGLGIKPP